MNMKDGLMAMDPLTSKGNSILSSMEKSYGSPEKAKQVFYASRNAGKISGVDADIEDEPRDKNGKWTASGEFHESLGIERKAMPQIPGPVKDAFVDWAKGKGVKMERTTAPVSELKPSQKHFNPEQAQQIPAAELKFPILVSEDNHVLDGHNRWARMYGDDPKQAMNVIRIGLPAKEALKLMEGFPKAGEKKDLHQVGATHANDDAGAWEDEPRKAAGEAGGGQWTSGGSGGEIKDESGSEPPAPGQSFRVYRLGNEGEQALENTNAGNAQGVAEHLARIQDIDKPQFKGGSGNTLHAYNVRMSEPFDKYAAFVSGEARKEASKVGRSEKFGTVNYSFPKGGNFEHQHAGSIPLKELLAGLNGRNFDDLGSIAGGEAIRDAFKKLAAKPSDEEVGRRLREAAEAFKSMPSTASIDTPERQKLRTDIEKALYAKDIDKRKHDRECDILLGLPASGKSTLSRKIQEAGGGGYLEVDPDLAKEYLPEYKNGVGAAAVHDESSSIAKNVFNRAVQNGDNIIWPRVDNPEKTIGIIKALKENGYKVHVHYIDMDRAYSQQAVIERFLKSGRYVSPAIVAGYGDKPKQSFKLIGESGLADSLKEYERGPKGVVERPSAT